MKRVLKICFVFALQVFLFFLLSLNVDAATITAANCSQSTVQSAVTSAASGDTVTIPSGSCTWGTAISINKKITVKGAGSNSTVITSSGQGVSLFTIGGGVRITGIGFRMYGSTNLINASGKGWRIDHCSFSRVDDVGVSGAYAVFTKGSNVASSPAGLIDNSTFNDCRIYAGGVSSFNEQHKIWNAPAGFGDQDAVYVEDNDITRIAQGNVIDASYSGKYVFRFNTYRYANIEAHDMPTPNGSRATRRTEIYNNIAIGNYETTKKYQRPGHIRGGETLIFNNTIQGKWGTPYFDISVRRTQANYDADYCNGNDPKDSNDREGWLCRDQPGAGRDSVLTTSTGSYGNYKTSWGAQMKSPVYAWGNNTTINVHVETSPWALVEERDYYDGGTWGLQTSKTSPFNGTKGVGRGTFANMPDTCTAGVAYWVTDRGSWNKSGSGGQGQLYKCTSTNTWTLYYEPYTYPHPLRSGETPPPPDTDDIKPPSNFRISK